PTGREDAKGRSPSRSGSGCIAERCDEGGKRAPQVVAAGSRGRALSMADIALNGRTPKPIRDITTWDRLKVNRDWLGLWFMLPALAFLVLFLAYPLGLGIWMSFTDTRIGRDGIFVALENYEWLWDDSIFWLSVFNTMFYTL